MASDEIKQKRRKERKAEQSIAWETARRGPDSDIHSSVNGAIYGKIDPILMGQSRAHSCCFVQLSDLTREDEGRLVRLRARVATTRKRGRLAFVLLRGGSDSTNATVATIQGVACAALPSSSSSSSPSSEKLPKEMIDFIGSTPRESIVEVEAKVTVVTTMPQACVASATKSDIELSITKFHIISEANRYLPFLLEDIILCADEEAGHRGKSHDGERVEEVGKGGKKEDHRMMIISVGLHTRLDYRWLDLRTPATNALFKLKSKVCHLFRQFLIDNDFLEVHTPRLLQIASSSATPTAANGGSANVSYGNGYHHNAFQLTVEDECIGQKACLATSTLPYRQLCVQGDLHRVFEVGPVFKKEHGGTHRHLTEFTSMDAEMVINETFNELVDMAESLFAYLFSKLDDTKEDNKKLAAAVRTQYPSQPVIWKTMVEPPPLPPFRSSDIERSSGDPMSVLSSSSGGRENGEASVSTTAVPCVVADDEDHSSSSSHSSNPPNHSRVLRLSYVDCVQLLNESPEQPKLSTTYNDMHTAHEKKLAHLVKQRYGVDFFIVYRFPSTCEPFHTMRCLDDAGFSNSFVAYIRGERVASGAQREHSVEALMSSARQLGADIPSAYTECFQYGAWPHGGLSIGLERFMMAYFDLKNIRVASLFPRDASRLTP